MAEKNEQVAGATTDAAESAGASTEAAAEEMLPKSQVEKLIAARVSKLRGENERLRKELEAAAKRGHTGDEDEEPPTGASPDERWRKRLERLRAEAEVERQELLAKLEAETRAHQRTRIEHAVLAECARRGNVRDVPLVVKLVLDDLEIGDDGTIRAKDGVSDLPKYLDGWLKEHEVFVAAPPRGDGLRVGGRPGAAARSVADMPEMEAYGAAAKRLVGA